MSFDPTTRTFRVDSDDEDLIDEVKTYKMRVELADYPTATYPTASFLEYESTVTFQDPSLVGDVCENPNIASITTETQTASVTDNFSGTPKTWTYVPYTIAPAICTSKLSVICVEITGPNTDAGAAHPLECSDYEIGGSNGNDLSFTFSQSQYDTQLAPGTYTFTYNVTTDINVPELTKTLTFDLILTDICDDSSNTITATSALPNVDYTITDTKKSIATTGIFTITPTVCPFSVAVNIGTLTGNQTPISEVTDAVEIEYDADLAIVGES